MQKLLKFLGWIDNNIVKLLTVGFIFLIPLYPKFPLKFIDYTYIAIRVEDIYVALLAVVFFVQLLRQKVKLNKKFMWLILAFWAAVLASFLWGTFVQKTIIYKHLGFLHSIRRIEYSLIFFIIVSTIRSRKDFLLYLHSSIITLIIVSLYGAGQKFLGWPAVQTMNPEFAKGHILYLTPEARISSTFGGHYDLAAYLVFLLPFTLTSAIFYGALRKSQIFGEPEKNVAVNGVVSLVASMMVWAAPIILGIDIQTSLATFFVQGLFATLVIMVGLVIVGMFAPPDLSKTLS